MYRYQCVNKIYLKRFWVFRIIMDFLLKIGACGGLISKRGGCVVDGWAGGVILKK